MHNNTMDLSLIAKVLASGRSFFISATKSSNVSGISCPDCCSLGFAGSSRTS